MAAFNDTIYLLLHSAVHYHSVLRSTDVGSDNISAHLLESASLTFINAHMMLPVPVIVVFSNSSNVNLLKNAGGDLQVVRRKNVFSST